ncbi:MAG TPA: hypothetical protein ENJ55_07890 [Rhizobiales bacterium]|nr:hypothetical protein [Hyphomicrobiales bacterium]
MFSNTMIRNFKIMSMLAGAAFLAVTATANAQPKPTLLGSFKDWAAYTYKSGKSKVCYIVSQPKDSTPKGLNRDAVFFLVTHRPGDKVRNEVNTIIGYPYKKGSTSSVTIDNASKFKFFTSGDGAWAGSKEADAKVVRAMKAGTTMVVVGRSGRGTKTIDKYSLAGVSAAMKKIDETCR